MCFHPEVSLRAEPDRESELCALIYVCLGSGVGSQLPTHHTGELNTEMGKVTLMQKVVVWWWNRVVCHTLVCII